MRFLEPIVLEGEAGDAEAIEQGYARIEEAMQAAMDDLSRDRLPWLGRPESAASPDDTEGAS
jgi:hypothetical protein